MGIFPYKVVKTDDFLRVFSFIPPLPPGEKRLAILATPTELNDTGNDISASDNYSGVPLKLNG